MGFWNDLLGVVNKTLSTVLGVVGIPASPNTLHRYEKALFSNNPVKNLAETVGEFMDPSNPDNMKNIITVGTSAMAKNMGLNLTPDDITNGVKIVEKHVNNKKLTHEEVQAINNKDHPKINRTLPAFQQFARARLNTIHLNNRYK